MNNLTNDWPLIEYFIWNTDLWEVSCEVNPPASTSLKQKWWNGSETWNCTHLRVRSYCWPQHCYRIAVQSPFKWRLDLPTTNKGFKWGCDKEILCSFTFGVELSTTNVSWKLSPLISATINLGKASINFGDMSLHCAHILRGCLNSWHVLIAVQPWTWNHEFHMEKCPTCKDRSPTFSTRWCSKKYITLGTPKVPKSWKFSSACPGSDWDCVVGSNVLTVYTPKDPDRAESFSLRHCYCGLQSEQGLPVVRIRSKGRWKWPSCHSFDWKMDMSWLLLAQLFWPCVKDAQD